MDAFRGLEKTLNEAFVKNAPFQLSDGIKRWITEYAWILAIIITVVGGFALLALLAALGVISVIAVTTSVSGYGLFAWLGLFVLGVHVVLASMSISPLKAKLKHGWDLIFYSQLISVAYNLFGWLFAGSFGTNFLSILWDLLVIILAFYILFQVRGGFIKSRNS